MRCCYCKINEATKTYELIKNNKKTVEYYCMDCYEKLFLTVDQTDRESSLSTCPYCGMTVEEFRSKKIVGCAYCYRSMKVGITPTIIKMQGEKTHQGKTPPLEFGGDGMTVYLDEESRKKVVERARFERKCNELEIIIAKLQKENNYEDAKCYADKLSSMRSNGAVEEEFVWRTRRSLLKQ